jgi:hypothetical protein
MSKSSPRKILSLFKKGRRGSLAQRETRAWLGFWMVASIACGIWAFKLYELKSMASGHWYLFPAGLSFIAVSATVLIISGRVVSRVFPAYLILACLVFDSGFTSFLASWSIGEADRLGLMFLLLAIVYRGKMSTFWFLFLPLSVVAVYSPLAAFEGTGKMALLVLLRSALIPTMSLLSGAMAVSVRDVLVQLKSSGEHMKNFSKRGGFLRARIESMEHELQETLTMLKTGLENDIESVVESGTEAAMEMPFETAMKTTEFASSHQAFPMGAHTPTETLSYIEVHDTLKNLLNEKQKSLNRPGVKLALTAAVDLAMPLAVRANRASLDLVLNSMISQSIDSLGGGIGNVRITLKPSLSEISILIEDNGRGFNEDLLRRANGGLLPSQRISFNDARSEIEKVGGKMELNARLGVGSRVNIELPRVDAMVGATRARSLKDQGSQLGSIGPRLQSNLH